MENKTLRRKEKQGDRIKAPLVALFGFLSFVSMFLYSENSPFYATNPWSGPNYFMTVGKGIVHGLVPYKDLFEQKGPVLYFLHALAYLVTGNNFYGVYLLESLSLLTSLCLFYKIARYFLTERFAFFASLFLPALILGASSLFANTAWFVTGDSAEEFAFPAILYLIYVIIRKTKENRFRFSTLDLFTFGLITGLLFWTKYTMIGAYVGFYVYWAARLLLKKDLRHFVRGLVVSALGFCVATLPILLYFLLNNGLNALFNVYFWVNLTTYGSSKTFLGHLHQIAQQLLNGFRAYPFLFLLAAAEVYYIVKNLRRKSDQVQIGLIATSFAFATIFALSDGQPWIYYFLILVPFFSLGWIASFEWLEPFFKGKNKLSMMTALASIFLAILFPFLVNNNLLDSKLFAQNNKTPQLTFAKLIDRVPHATLLSYGVQDVGFYMAADVLPTSPYFAQNNIAYKNFPALNDGQSAVIADKKVDFVVTDAKALVKSNELINPKSKVPEYLALNYQLVTSQTDLRNQETYFLYENKKLTEK